MNPTERYIKMCEKAEEIQKEWEPKTGDWAIDVWHRNPVVVIEKLDSKNLLVSQVGGGQYENTRDKFIWLPTQEQLEEMFDLSIPTLMVDFYNFVLDGAKLKFSTFNELWLTFVMQSKYRKVWEREKWRKR